MKTIKLSVLSAILSIVLFSSCKKDSNVNETSHILETPLKTAIEAKTAITELDTYSYNNSIELGYKFHSSKVGKITRLGCLYPNKGNVVVSLWDFDSKILLASTAVNITDENKFAYTNITPVNIAANKNYVVSLYVSNSNSLVYTGTTNGNTIFPFTTGNVFFECPMYKYSTVITFPANVSPDSGFIDGIVDFVIEY